MDANEAQPVSSEPQEATDPEPVEHLARIEGTLARVFRREGFEGVVRRTPLDELIAGEEEEQTVNAAEEIRLARSAAFIAAIRFIFADGPHPGSAMKRLYSLARAVDPDSIARMNGTDLAQIFDETRAAQSYRVKMMFGPALKKQSTRGAKLPFQKPPSSCAKMAKAQLGNCNRLGSKINDIARGQQANL